MISDGDRCLAAGMNGYLSKPLRTRALFTLLDHYAELGTAPTATSLAVNTLLAPASAA
ncbi:MAG: hypothetical protein ABI629_11750 [bacterium]